MPTDRETNQPHVPARRAPAWRGVVASEQKPGEDGKKDASGDGTSGGKSTEGGENPARQARGPSRGMFGFIVLMLLVVTLVMFLSNAGRGQEIKWPEFKNHYESKLVVKDSIKLGEGAITARVLPADNPDATEEEATSVRIVLNAADREEAGKRLYELTGGEYTATRPSEWLQVLYFFGPFILLILLIWFIIGRGLRSAAGGGGMLGSFGKSRHRTLTKEMTGVTFNDVAGIQEAKEEVTEIIEFLKQPKKFTKLGGRIPRGVLLVGEPGCGKTLLAKAIAGEAEVPFFSISGSDFVEMFVGVGASRVRDLFKQAKESSPCIIFLDEIDAVGRRRGGGFSSGGHDEREQTLNAILVEMDGFESGDGVIVIAATNRGDVLDPALIRPGRFDRQITVPLPDVKGRLDILKVHAKKVKLGPDVHLEKIARGTPMFSGADLAAIINEAAIAATMANKDFIEHEDLEEARDKVRFGRSKKSRVREDEENRLTAYHEAGHAVLQAVLKDSDPLHKVTIIPRGQYGGATFSLPEKDRSGYNLKWLRATMIMACGGRIAEERAMQDVSSGAMGDIAQVTQLARLMVLEWGMSPRLGFVRYAGEDTRDMFVADKDYSEDTARLIDEEIRRLVDEAYSEAERLLSEHWEQVEAVAESLIKYETLNADEVHKIMRGEDLDKPTVADLLATDRKRSRTPPPAPSGGEEPDLPPGTAPSPA